MKLAGTTLGDHTLAVDGTEETASGAATVATNDQHHRVGVQNNTSYLNGKVAEIALTGELTAGEITNMRTYFGTRYGITIS